MTTTPSPELPDLDLNELEALCAAAPRMWYGTLQIADGVTDDAAALLIEACSPDTVAELVRLARRAQPEGEAPQAEPVYFYREKRDGASWVECSRQWQEKTRTAINGSNYEFRTLYTHPAAQHAESGAECRACRGTGQDGDCGADGAPVPCVCLECKGTGFAAQSQGAQPDAWAVVVGEDMANTIHLTVDAEEAKAEYEASVEGGFESIYNLFPLYRSAALAAKAAAPAPRTELSKRIREAATVDVTEKQAWLLIGAAEEIERAQQAAAPGALDADEMTRLRRLMCALGHTNAFELSDEYVRGVMCTVLGQAVREMERLRTLLNTPELHDFAKGVVLEAAHQRDRWSTSHDAGKAPADWFWLLGYLGGKALKAHNDGNTEKALHHTISTAAACANWHAAVLGKTSMRPGIDPPVEVAAQLDGGQGEGK